MSSHSVILILKKHLITLTIAHPQKISSENRQSLLKTRPQQVTALCSLIFSSLSTSSFFEYSINNNVVLYLQHFESEYGKCDSLYLGLSWFSELTIPS